MITRKDLTDFFYLSLNDSYECVLTPIQSPTQHFEINATYGSDPKRVTYIVLSKTGLVNIHYGEGWGSYYPLPDMPSVLEMITLINTEKYYG